MIPESTKDLLVVILSQVFSFLQDSSTSEVKGDLTVFVGSVAKLPKLLLPLAQRLALHRGQPLVGVGGKIIALIVQHLSSANTEKSMIIKNIKHNERKPAK